MLSMQDICFLLNRKEEAFTTLSNALRIRAWWLWVHNLPFGINISKWKILLFDTKDIPYSIQILFVF